MKYILRTYFFNVFALWFTSQILPSLTISGGWQAMFVAGLFLSILTLLVAPVLKILFIPINIMTLGLFSWLVNVAVVYVLTIFVPNVQIRQFAFAGSNTAGFVIPSMAVSYPVSLILTSLTITVISNLLHYASES